MVLDLEGNFLFTAYRRRQRDLAAPFRKLDGILDEEDRYVVADNVLIAFLGIKLDGEPSDVVCEIKRFFAFGYCREPDKCQRPLASALKKVSACIFRKRFVVLEIAMRAITPRMDDPLGNPFVVKVEDLFPEVKVFKKRWTARTDFQRVLIVRNRSPLGCRQQRDFARRDLM